MPYQRCPTCKFWVTPEDRHCPDCGTWRPYPPEPGFSSLGAGLGCFAGALMGGSFGAVTGDWCATAFCGAVAAGLAALVGGTVPGAVAEGTVRVIDDWKGPAAESLQRYERTIRKRLIQIDTALMRLELVRERARRETPDGEWGRLLHALETAHHFYGDHRARYQLQLWDVEFARWRNQVEPLALAAEELTFEGCEERLRGLERLTASGERLLADVLDPSQPESPHAHARADRVRDALSACGDLRRGLIARQARAVIEKARPLDEARRGSPTPAALVQPGRFTARAELDRFASSLRQLEAEHARLQAELEVSGYLPPMAA